MVGPKTGRPAGAAGPAARRGGPLGAALCVAPPVPAPRAGASITTSPALSGVLLPCLTLLAIRRVVRRPRCAPRLSSAIGRGVLSVIFAHFELGRVEAS
jgi:hypothetical protein